MRLVQLKIEGCNPCQSVYNFLTNTVGEGAFEVIDLGNADNKRRFSEVRMVPVVILYEDNGEEVKRVNGSDIKEIKELVRIFENEQDEEPT